MSDRLRHYRAMLLSRRFEERLAALYRQGQIAGGVYLGKGQEALSGALGLALEPGDILAPLIRDMAARLAFSEPLVDAARTYLGRVTGPMKGRDGNIHRGNVDQGILPMISHLGAMVSTVNGILFARRLQGQPMGVGATCIGEGGMNTGALHEGLNQAAVEKLPLVVVVADNGYAYSTPSSQSYVCADLADRAVGYGIAGYTCDGTDFDACRETIYTAVNAARAGEGPQLISAKMIRLCGHGEHDDATYADPDLMAAAGDCLAKAKANLLAAGEASDSDFAAIDAEVKAEIDTAVNQALAEPIPEAHAESWCTYADPMLGGGR